MSPLRNSFGSVDSGSGGWCHRQGPRHEPTKLGTLEVAMGLKWMISVESPPSLILMFTYSFFVQGGFRLISACYWLLFPGSPVRRWRKSWRDVSALRKKTKARQKLPVLGGLRAEERLVLEAHQVDSKLIPRWKMKVYLKQTNMWIFEPGTLRFSKDLKSWIDVAKVEWNQPGFTGGRRFFFHWHQKNALKDDIPTNMYLFGDANLER